MKPLVYAIVVLFAIFAINVGAFFLSDSYSQMIRKFKYGENGQKVEISDEYLANFDQLGNISCDCKCPEQTCPVPITPPTLPTQGNETTTQTQALTQSQTTLQPETPKTPEIDYSPLIDQVIQPLQKFEFKKLPYDEYYKIYGLTDEYPSHYERYETKFGEAYFFTGSTHDELYQFFEVQTDKLGYNLKKVNNFSKRSFYINMKKPDDYVRIVVETHDLLVGLYVKRNSYSEIKKLLKNF